MGIDCSIVYHYFRVVYNWLRHEPMRHKYADTHTKKVGVKSLQSRHLKATTNSSKNKISQDFQECYPENSLTDKL
jgi:hypothetical protein